MSSTSRREFLKFLGVGGASLLAARSGLASIAGKDPVALLGWAPLAPTDVDDLVLAKGFSARRLVTWGDSLGRGLRFGAHNDFTAFISRGEKEAWFWANHESVDPNFLHKSDDPAKRDKAAMARELQEVGGSLLELKLGRKGWELAPKGKHHRFDATTPIPFAAGVSVAGATHAVGTLANCAGGTTDWGTVLTCEENFQDFYGQNITDESGKRFEASAFGWETLAPRPPEHYGWVVEVDPKTRAAKKHTALGRFGHEGATFTRTKSGLPVVYMGDDRPGGSLYKFISNTKDSLETGRLFAADVKKGEWIELDRTKHSELGRVFSTQLEVLIETRRAAKVVGASALDRPEDIAINPANGDVIVALTNNYEAGNKLGSLLKLAEVDADPAAMKFKSATFLTGGSSGFACPDNLAFDKNGNLWLTTDMSGSQMNKGDYLPFKNNGLFYVPMSGALAGRVWQVASAPRDAEFTGPSFSPDGKTMFLSVQHPGEKSKSLKELSSHWPEGGTAIPRSAVVAITGPALI